MNLLKIIRKLPKVYEVGGLLLLVASSITMMIADNWKLSLSLAICAILLIKISYDLRNSNLFQMSELANQLLGGFK